MMLSVLQYLKRLILACLNRWLVWLLLLLSPALHAQEVIIPTDIIVSQYPKPSIVPVPGNPAVLINTLSVGTLKQVFQAPPCLEGQFYAAFQLYYDLGDAQTQNDWSAELSITLLDNTTELWTKPLGVQMGNQTFISTVFHDELLTCDAKYKIRIDAKTLTGTPPQDHIYLKFILHKYLEDDFVPNAQLSLNVVNPSDKSLVSWGHLDQQENKSVLQYDLEWVFIANHENFSGTNPEAFNFKEPVRITTADFEYNHSTFYPAGRIWYRIRAIGYNPQHPTHRIPGAWSYASSIITVNNPEPTRNWQAQVVFAEGGKFKKVVTYFDATLRDRQSQTSLSTNGDTTLIAESMYDYEGRKSISMLAVPTASTSLNYKPSFNKFDAQDGTVSSNTSFPIRQKFHYDNGALSNSIVSTTSGAGMYYSPDNNLASFRKDYIPDAEGYVYSQTEYLNDGTGRVRRHAGVGKEFRMDGAHTTKYFYANAQAEELIRLFGNNVGNVNHYKKNMVVDPNKQASISYLDQEGRVIATALAGPSPESLDALASNIPTNHVNVNVSQKNEHRNGISVLTQKILNTANNTSYTFNYSFSSLAPTLEGIGCTTCQFDLEMTITNPDGQLVVLPAIPTNESIDVFHFLRKNISITECLDPTTPIDIEFEVNLEDIGDYTITKTLVPKELTFEEAKTIVEQNTIVQAKIQSITSNHTVDATNCDICTDPEESETYIESAMDEIAYQDCQNIYTSILKDLEDNGLAPTNENISAHENYCQYELCLQDMESAIFEKKLARISTWTGAVTNGYSVTLSNSSATGNAADPFFANGANGYGARVTLQGKLDLITLPNLQYDANADGTPDTYFTGSLLSLTDPTNTDYYILSNGQLNAAGYHVLYFDLMSRKSSMPIADYDAELDKQRWTLAKMFYLEAKRKTKLTLAKYTTGCPIVNAELTQTDLLPSTETEIANWGTANGATGPVSDEEIEGAIYSLNFGCEINLSPADSTTIAGHLETYFNSNPGNILRLIFTEDLGSNPSLMAIDAILSNYSCDLSAVAQEDPTNGATEKSIMEVPVGSSTTNLINNPALDRNAGCSGSNNITSSCFPGWAPASGSPNTGSTGQYIFLWARCGTTSEAARGSFSSPLVPGKKYKMCFSYRTHEDTGVYGGEVDRAYIQLSRGTQYSQTVGGGGMMAMTMETESKMQSSFTEDSIAMFSSQMEQSVMALGACSNFPGPVSIDPVYIGESTTPTNELWMGTNLTNVSPYISVCIEFTPTEASTYFYISTMPVNTDVYQAVVVKDFSLTDISAETDTLTFDPVVTEYDSSNSTLANWSFEVDQAAWDQVIQKCIDNTVAENEILLERAVDKLIEKEATTFFSQLRTNCLENVQEHMTFSYESSEYHYTLYYYDQAGNLVQTVPPEGAHLATQYKYNSFNQLIWQKTSDAGQSQFYYDAKGQLRLSQNAQQSKDNKYSYSKYDKQGRVIEVGEMYSTESIPTLLADIEQPFFPEASAERILTDITKTYFDIPNPEIQPEFQQEYLRTRVARVEVLEKDAVDVIATHYSYDIHGNVKSLLQQIPGLPDKRTDYQYDLISGNVNYVFYQYGKYDQFIHNYKYDADNRLVEVLTSTDGYIWDSDARYRYYQHGPLARVELGQYRVQGLDYYYTLQGWIKGVNMPYAADPGKDGYAGVNLRAGRDVFAYTLGYFQGDYKPSSAAVYADTRDQLWTRFEEIMGTDNDGLHNGNISWMVTDLKKIGQEKQDRTKGVQAMLYRYDQLNRIVQSRSLTDYNPTNGFEARVPGAGAYDESFSYDANGNILTFQRNDELGAIMDDFNYSYYKNSNKLRFLNPVTVDTVYTGNMLSNEKLYNNITIQASANVTTGGDVTIRATNNIDFEDGFDLNDNTALHAYIIGEDEGNYNYDAIGNLIKDRDERVSIEWTPYGKIRKVNRVNGSSTSFRYDGAGNRIEKKFTKSDESIITTRYVRDVSGNVMGVYSDTTLTEQSIYGSSRLGVYQGGRVRGVRELGRKNFELSNHLGNVLSVITDNINMTADSTWSTVLSANDYYAFGLEMEGRTWSDTTSTYRYGFNGKESESKEEWGGSMYDFGARMYNPTIGRWFAPDVHASKYPAMSPYSFVGNMPIIAIDPDGKDILLIGEPDFQIQFFKALIQLSRTKAGRHIVTALLNSEATYKVKQYTEGATYKQGNTLYLNPDDFDIPLPELEANGTGNGALIMPSYILLGHEFGHFYTNEFGSITKDSQKSIWANGYGPLKTFPATEIDAVHIENILRAQSGLPLRSYYGGREVRDMDLSDQLVEKGEQKKYPYDADPNSTPVPMQAIEKLIPNKSKYLYYDKHGFQKGSFDEASKYLRERMNIKQEFRNTTGAKQTRLSLKNKTPKPAPTQDRRPRYEH